MDQLSQVTKVGQYAHNEQTSQQKNEDQIKSQINQESDLQLLSRENRTLKDEIKKYQDEKNQLQEQNKQLGNNCQNLHQKTQSLKQELILYQQRDQFNNDQLIRLQNQLEQQNKKLQEQERDISPLRKILEQNKIEIYKLQSILQQTELNQKQKNPDADKVVNKDSQIMNNQLSIYDLCQYYIEKNKKLEQEFQNFLGMKEELEKLKQNQINQKKKMEDLSNNKIVKMQKFINTYDFKKQDSKANLLKECSNLINNYEIQQQDEIKFKCCEEENEIISCKQIKCFYHLKCIKEQLITNEQLQMLNCDCGDQFPQKILRKLNQVSAKCKLEQILEHQADQLLKQQKEKKCLIYKCPNQWCNFYWCYKPTQNGIDMGQISYCLNCQVKVYSNQIQME